MKASLAISLLFFLVACSHADQYGSTDSQSVEGSSSELSVSSAQDIKVSDVLLWVHFWLTGAISIKG